MAVDILIIRNNCDEATKWTNWIGVGLKDHLVQKGYSVMDLSDADASPENVNYWLDASSINTKKLAICFDHGSCDAFYGEKNNVATPVISKNNVEKLVKGIHVYTFACSTNGNNCVGQTAIEKGCYSWLGYTEPVYVITAEYPPLKECIWSYIDALADGKTIEQAEAALKKAYQDRFNNNWIFKYNYDRLLLRKSGNNMTINSHNRVVKWYSNQKITALFAGPEDRNIWVYVLGLGWRKLWNTSDAQVISMLSMAASAKAKKSNVTFLENDGRIEVMYIF